MPLWAFFKMGDYSNSDPKNTNETNDFFIGIYSKYNIIPVNTNRVINTKNGWKELKIWLISNERNYYDKDDN